ncbi:MAG: DegV family protein [Acetatifactor sp.]|nr:DegV family protein [Acetatifactor sp.]
MVKIIADSTCDLSKDLLEKYDISILPLHILLGEKEYLDGVNITPKEIYDWSDTHEATPKTSAPSRDAAAELMKPYVDEGREVVCFSISGEMSASGNVMRMAAEDLGEMKLVRIVDSANLSTGIGHLVIEAAIMAKDGMDADTIVGRIEELKPRVRASFVVDILTFLYRGGRCSGLAAMAGGVLKLHPKILVEDGKMRPGKKYRGRLDKAVMAYVTDMEEELKQAKKDRVFITHSGCDRELVEAVRTYLISLNHFDEVLETVAGGVISSHCGPGTLGVLYIA